MNHPLHPLLVHFPIACWSLATVGDATYGFWPGFPPSWIAPLGLLHVIGCATAAAAMLAGLMELDKAHQRDAGSAAQRHILFASATWMVYAASLIMRIDAGTILPPSWPAIALSCFGLVLLCVTGYCGGTLVYRFGVGVQRRE